MGRAVAVDEEDLKMLHSTVVALQTEVDILTYLVRKMMGVVNVKEGVEDED